MDTIAQYASRHTLTGVCKWDGEDSTYKLLRAWTLGKVMRERDTLYIESEDGMDIADIGDFIVHRGKGEFYVYTPSSFEDNYVLVTQNTHV